MVPIDSNSSNFGCSEIRRPMLRKRDINDDYEEEENSTGTEAMPRRRKQHKKNTIPIVSSSSSLPPTSKMAWTKIHELTILKGIVDYQKEKGSSYRSEWNLFYIYMKGLVVDMDFSKVQLQKNARNMKYKFSDIIKRSKNGERGVAFTSTDDEAVFRLSTIIWGNKEAECVSDKEDQREDFPVLDHDPTRVEIEQEENGSDELCVLQEVLGALTVFHTIGKNQQKIFLHNLENLPAQRKKELTNE